MPAPPTGTWQKLLDPFGLGLRGQLLMAVLCLCLSVLTVDRVASYLFWPSAGSQAVMLVGSPTCPHSRAARAHLVAKGVPFRELDTHAEPLMAGLAGWGLQSVRVPIVVVGTEVIYGNREDRIEEALAKLGHEKRPAG